MELPNKNKIKHYRGIAVYEKEAQALEALEKILKEPIPLFKKFTAEISFGFSVEDYSVIEIRLVEKDLTGGMESLAAFSNLQHLDLRHNQLSGLPESIGNLTNLQSLGLSDNQLSGLPESIGNLANLQILGLGDNQLSGLPESIGNLANLQGLYLRHNQFSNLPNTFSQLELSYLNIARNEFSEFSKPLWESMSKIDHLILGKGNFQTAPFKQVWRTLNLTNDAELKEFMETIVNQIFSEKQYQDLLFLIEPEEEMSRLDRETAHRSYLQIATSASRAFYGSLIGVGFLKFYTILFGGTLEFSIYLFLMSVLFTTFIGLERLAWYQERKVVKNRNTFISKAKGKMFLTVDRFEEILKKRYLLLESQLKSARYQEWYGFSSNVIITSITTLFFVILSTGLKNGNSDPSENYLWPTVIVTLILIGFSSSILILLIGKYRPKIREDSDKVLRTTVKEYADHYKTHVEEPIRLTEKQIPISAASVQDDSLIGVNVNEVKEVYNKLHTAILLGKIRQKTYQKRIQNIEKLADNERWGAIKEILEQTIKFSSSTQREKLYQCLGEDITEKYIQNYIERRE